MGRKSMNIAAGSPTYTEPTVGQIINTQKHVGENFKMLYHFEMAHGDPIGERWVTQHLRSGMIVRVDGRLHEVISAQIGSTESGSLALTAFLGSAFEL